MVLQKNDDFSYDQATNLNNRKILTETAKLVMNGDMWKTDQKLEQKKKERFSII